MKRIGILTGGGDCPGLNPVIRAVVRAAKLHGWTVIGFKRGWKGIIENDFVELSNDSVAGILQRGGTILGTSRTNPYKKEGDVQKVRATMAKNKLDALVAVGGEDTLGAGNKLFKDGVHVVGVPKTIDNDLNATDYTFGYDTALGIATDCLDRLRTTAESHERVIVAEIMGRHAGWIALESGIAGAADVVLIPEVSMTADEICAPLMKRLARGKRFGVVAVSEGFSIKGEDIATTQKELDAFGHVRLGGIGDRLAKLIEKKTGIETRSTVLGHIQRGGTPTAFDRILGTRFGVKAVELIEQGQFGKMVSLRGREIVAVPLQEAVGELKTVPPELYELAKKFFG
ncbi:MAG TPA: ATP-dependent 6-phosphofructokinase [Candidatus Omnitrophota bacterium]|nr:ATP-dependent 6-phosphofructokinase [Candidatus Omnitrophota bacterium]